MSLRKLVVTTGLLSGLLLGAAPALAGQHVGGSATCHKNCSPTPSPSPTASAGPTVSPSPTVSPTASPTASPSPSASPTTSASASPTSSPTPVSPSPSPSSTPTSAAPNTQGSWVSPEGVHLNVNTAGPFTLAKIYDILKANALDLDKVGPTLTINVQDSYSSQTTTSAGTSGGRYKTYIATMYLKGDNSAFYMAPDTHLTHEYVHAWSGYWLYLGHQGVWTSYLDTRWSTSDGSMVLSDDPRLDSAYAWNRSEIIAEDYRLLFGDSTVLAQAPNHMNTDLPAPSAVTGLRAFMSGSWRTYA
jgi:hypothetical protein